MQHRGHIQATRNSEKPIEPSCRAELFKHQFVMWYVRVPMYVIVCRCVQISYIQYIQMYMHERHAWQFGMIYIKKLWPTISRKSNSSFGLVWGISFQICFPVQVSKRLGHPKVARKQKGLDPHPDLQVATGWQHPLSWHSAKKTISWWWIGVEMDGRMGSCMEVDGAWVLEVVYRCIYCLFLKLLINHFHGSFRGSLFASFQMSFNFHRVHLVSRERILPIK